MLQILDPHLRPVPPAPMDQTSQKIYDDHMKLAQEYFKVIFSLSHLHFVRICLFWIVLRHQFYQNQTEIAYLTKHKESILQNMTPEERKRRLDYCSKLKEKVSSSAFNVLALCRTSMLISSTFSDSILYALSPGSSAEVTVTFTKSTRVSEQPKEGRESGRGRQLVGSVIASELSSNSPNRLYTYIICILFYRE